VAVRQRGSRRDSLWLLGPGAARLLREKVRLDELPPALVHQVWKGGPRAWPWEKVQDAMFF
jgi:hypothetical protein